VRTQRSPIAGTESTIGYPAALVEHTDARGHRLVRRNGHARPRTVTTAAGAVEVRAPWVNDRRIDPDTGERCRFRSSIIAPWCRNSPKVSEVLLFIHLHGVSSGDRPPALGELFGSAGDCRRR
jgi:putative transposase